MDDCHLGAGDTMTKRKDFVPETCSSVNGALLQLRFRPLDEKRWIHPVS